MPWDALVNLIAKSQRFAVVGLLTAGSLLLLHAAGVLPMEGLVLWGVAAGGILCATVLVVAAGEWLWGVVSKEIVRRWRSRSAVIGGWAPNVRQYFLLKSLSKAPTDEALEGPGWLALSGLYGEEDDRAVTTEHLRPMLDRGFIARKDRGGVVMYRILPAGVTLILREEQKIRAAISS